MKRFRGRTRCLTIVLLLMVCGDVQSAELPPERAEDPGDVPIRSVYSQPLFNEMNASWTAFMEALQRHGSKGSDYLIRDVNKVRMELGIPNLFIHSDVLVRYAARASREGKVDDAETLYSWATLLAPDNPAPFFGRARLPLQEGTWELGSRVNWFFKGVQLTTVHRLERLRVKAKWGSLWMMLGIFVFLGYQLGLLVRYLPLLARDLADRLPRGVSSFHTQTALWILALTPIAFGVDWLILGCGWVLTSMLYLSLRERLCVAISVLWVFSVPLTNDMVNRSLEGAGKGEVAIFNCAYSYCSPSELKEVEQEVARTGLGLAQEALARHYLRRYLYDRKGGDVLEMHLARALSVAKNKAIIYSLEGNYLYAKFGSECRSGAADSSKTRKSAIEAWERALSMDPERYDAAHNLALAHRLSGLVDEAGTYYAAARSLGEEEVTRFEQSHRGLRMLSVCPGAFNGNRYLMVPPILDAESEGDAQEASALTGAFGGMFISGDKLEGLRQFSLGLLSAVLLFAIVARFIRHAWRCDTCHQVASGVNESEYSLLGMCEQCVSRRVKGTLWDPKASFFAARLQERAWARKRSLYRGIAYCVPGWGHVLFNRPIHGFLFFTLTCALLLSGLLWLPGETPAAGVLELSQTSFLLSIGGCVVVFLLNGFSVYRLGRGR